MRTNYEELKIKFNVGATSSRPQEKGITLVALVITIIVLIILAGVSINAIMSDGLIDNAKTAKEDYNKGQIKEEKDIGKLEQEIENAQGKWRRRTKECSICSNR